MEREVSRKENEYTRELAYSAFHNYVSVQQKCYNLHSIV